MTPAEQIKHLQSVNNEKVKELNEQINMNKYLTNESTQNTVELELLRRILSKCINYIEINKNNNNKNEYENEDNIEAEAAQELTRRIKKAKSDVENAIKLKDDDAVKVFKRDLNNLTKISSLILSKQYKLAYFSLFTLAPIIRSSIVKVAEFLSQFGNEHENDNDNDKEKDDDEE